MTTLEPGASEVLTHGLAWSPRSTAFLASSPAAIITEGLEVLVQLVMAAITTCPWSRSKWAPSARRTGTVALGRPLTPVGSGSNHPGAGSPLACTAGGSLAGNDSADASSGPATPGTVGTEGGSISSSARRKAGLASLRATRSCGRLGPARLGPRVVEEALLLGIGLDEGDLLGRAAGEPQVAQRLVVDGEDRAGGAVLRRHVADGGAVLDRDVADPGTVELDELADHAVAAQQLGDGEHQVGRGR